MIRSFYKLHGIIYISFDINFIFRECQEKILA